MREEVLLPQLLVELVRVVLHLELGQDEGSAGCVLRTEDLEFSLCREARELAPEAGSFGFHVPAGVFHSIVALESGTVFIEIKAGPYAVPVAAEWGQWAPAEGEPGVASYLAEMKGAFTAA